MIVDLSILKQHVRADDHNEDDQYLEHLLASAEAHVLRTTRRTAEELTALGGGEYPADIKHAVLLICGHWYNQRESVSGVQMHEVPGTVQALLKPYRRLV